MSPSIPFSNVFTPYVWSLIEVYFFVSFNITQKTDFQIPIDTLQYKHIIIYLHFIHRKKHTYIVCVCVYNDTLTCTVPPLAFSLINISWRTFRISTECSRWDSILVYGRSHSGCYCFLLALYRCTIELFPILDYFWKSSIMNKFI